MVLAKNTTVIEVDEVFGVTDDDEWRRERMCMILKRVKCLGSSWAIRKGGKESDRGGKEKGKEHGGWVDAVFERSGGLGLQLG